MTQVPWSQGKSLIWDATVVDTLAASYIQRTSQEPAAAAVRAEELKRSKYISLCSRYVFVPLAFETFGTWGPEALDFARKVGGLLSGKSGDPRSTTFFKQRL